MGSVGLGQTIPSHSIPAAHPAAGIFLVNKLIIYFGFFSSPLTCFQFPISFNITGRISDTFQICIFSQLAGCFSYLFFIEGITKKIFQLLFPISFH